jgi:glycosyltransferase involved in cell wall biosynthesis
MTTATNRNNNDTPLVSVMMVTYERHRLLRHALRQLDFQQNVGGLQVVVVDDSRDGPDDVTELQDCLSILKHDENEQNQHTLMYHYSEARMAIGAKRNKAVELASAPHVIQVDDDDLYSPHRIAYQLEPLLQNNDNNNSNNRADITMLQQHTWACLDPHSNDHPQFYEATEQFQQHCHYGTLCFSKHIYPTVHYPKDSSLGEDLAFVECAEESSTTFPPPKIVVLSNQDDHHVYVRHGGATNVGHDLSRDSRFKPVQRGDLMEPLRQVALHLPSPSSSLKATTTDK